MQNEKYFRLLAKDCPSITSIQVELIRLRSLGDLPKGTEYFFSDLHGEAEAFIHMLRSASGNIRVKIGERFDGVLSEEEQNQLANLVYQPENVLRIMRDTGRADVQWRADAVGRLGLLCRHIAVKYRRSTIEEKMPSEYASILRELLFSDDIDPFRREYNAGDLVHRRVGDDLGFHHRSVQHVPAGLRQRGAHHRRHLRPRKWRPQDHGQVDRVRQRRRPVGQP